MSTEHVLDVSAVLSHYTNSIQLYRSLILWWRKTFVDKNNLIQRKWK